MTNEEHVDTEKLKQIKFDVPKTSKKQLRKKAYEYVKSRISGTRGTSRIYIRSSIMPLNDLMSLKNGISDPSEILVSFIKQILNGSVTEEEIEAQLVTPFKRHIT